MKSVHLNFISDEKMFSEGDRVVLLKTHAEACVVRIADGQQVEVHDGKETFYVQPTDLRHNQLSACDKAFLEGQRQLCEKLPADQYVRFQTLEGRILHVQSDRLAQNSTYFSKLFGTYSETPEICVAQEQRYLGMTDDDFIKLLRLLCHGDYDVHPYAPKDWIQKFERICAYFQIGASALQHHLLTWFPELESRASLLRFMENCYPTDERLCQIATLISSGIANLPKASCPRQDVILNEAVKLELLDLVSFLAQRATHLNALQIAANAWRSHRGRGNENFLPILECLISTAIERKLFDATQYEDCPYPQCVHPDVWHAGARTFFILAARHGCLHLIQQLIRQKTGINIRIGGTRALHEAAAIGRMDIVQCLVEAGADPTCAPIPDFDASLCRLIAATRDEENEQQLAILSYLLERGADPRCAGTLNMVVRRGRLATLKLFMPYFTGYLPIPESIVWEAFYREHWETIQFILPLLPDKEYLTQSRIATLLSWGSSGSIHHKKMWVWICAKWGASFLHQTLSSEDISTLSALLCNGVDPNVRLTSKQETALMLASQKHQDTHVEILLDKGADPNLRDIEGRTALDRTDWFSSTARLLVAHGAHARFSCNLQ